jgi:hypothetical protein
MKDPSILDYVKSLLKPKNVRMQFNFSPGKPNKKRLNSTIRRKDRKHFPTKIVLAVLLSLLAQYFLEIPEKQTTIAILLYILVGFLMWIEFQPIPSQGHKIKLTKKGSSVRLFSFCLSLIFLLAAFFSFTGNRFTLHNISFWVSAFILFFFSVWEKSSNRTIEKRRKYSWIFLLVITSLIIIFFRVYQLQQIPGEMFSDHAEKLLDVSDVLNGQYSIFFPRNTGREAFQFYLTFLIIKLFGTGLSFTSLKIGSVLAGLLTLPYIYLLGKELENKWVGLAAFFLAGIAYWPNVISRIGLRFPLYALFAAPTIYYLILGLRYGNRNNFILSGIALGLGLHGYSPFRIMPFVVFFGFIVAWFANKSDIYRKTIFFYFCLLAFTAFIVFLPLVRYAIEEPVLFGIRAFSRLTAIERPLANPAWQIFFTNSWNALTMFFLSDGEIWVHSIPFRPALDLITAVFFFVGLIILIKRLFQFKEWKDLYLFAMIPLLMLPSILSLAFPRENPSLNRTNAAIIPVFVIAGNGLVYFFQRIYSSAYGKFTRIFCCAIIGLLLVGLCFLNFQLVFKDYNQQYMEKAWNTTEIGGVIKDFVKKGGDPNLAFVIPFPYWVDTRLVGINAGFPTKDYALTSDQIADTVSLAQPKLFIIKPEDGESLKIIHGIFPDANIEIFYSKQSDKNFIIIRVG